MKIFRVSLVTLHYCGVVYDKKLSVALSKLTQSLLVISLIFFVVSASLFFIDNVSDMLIATEGVYLTGAALVALLLLINHKLNRHLIHTFISDLHAEIERGRTILNSNSSCNIFRSVFHFSPFFSRFNR